MDEPSSAPLAGFTVAVTAARRREELTSLLERRGARVLEAPAIRIVPTHDDVELLAVTRSCVEQAPDVVVATTGIGFRGWMEAADGWGLGEALRACLGGAELLARGPQGEGRRPCSRPRRSRGRPPPRRPTRCSPGCSPRAWPDGASRSSCTASRCRSSPARCGAAGAEVVEVPVYRWVLPEDVRPLRRLVEQTVAGAVDCMTFTSAPAVSSTLTVARELGREDELVEALRGPVLVAAVGPVTAGPLDRAGIPSVQPERARLGALVRTVVEELPARRTRTTRAGDHVLELRGHCVLVDGRSVELTARQVGVLSALVDGGGRVLSRADLLRTAWRDEPADEHAVEMTVARLRSALGPAGRVVETVVKRGYRLAAAA